MPLLLQLDSAPRARACCRASSAGRKATFCDHCHANPGPTLRDKLMAGKIDGPRIPAWPPDLGPLSSIGGLFFRFVIGVTMKPANRSRQHLIQLLTQFQGSSGCDGRRSGTRHGLPLWRLQRGPHRCPPIQYSDLPHPRIHEVNGLLSAWFPTFVKRPAVCLRSNRPPAKRNTAHQRKAPRARPGSLLSSEDQRGYPLVHMKKV
jgi:hypothetical protein